MLNATFFVYNKDTLLNQALQSDIRRSSKLVLSAYDGIPVGLKSNIFMYNALNNGCSLSITNKTWFSSKLSATLSRLGFLLYSKNNCDEFAVGSKTQSKFYGKSYNPWNLNKTPGGSSGGSGVAVASGQQFLSVGSDTGGSVRQPANLCSIVGFKPSYTLMSRFGLLPFSSSLDTIGFLGSTIVDVLNLFKDTVSFDINGNNPVVKTVNCWSKIAFLGDFIDNKNKPLFKKITFLLKSMGYEVINLSTNELCRVAVPLYYIISSIEAVSNFSKYRGLFVKDKSDYLRRTGYNRFISNFRGNFFNNLVKYRLLLGEFFALGSYGFVKRKAQTLSNKVIKYFSTIFNSVGFLILPATPRRGNPSTFDKDVQTVLSNLAGLPSLVTPFIQKTIKCFGSIQVIGGVFSDLKLLNFSIKLNLLSTIN